MRCITDGKVEIGAFTLGDRKKPILFVKKDGQAIQYGTFQSKVAAEAFMEELSRMVGAKKETEG